MTRIAFIRLAIFSIVLILTFTHGGAIICYHCNSAYDPRCGDPFDPYTLGTVNCSFQPRLEHLDHLEPTICRKISQRVYGQVRVVRGCGFIDDISDSKSCTRRSGTHDVLAVYCACTDNLCNGALTKLPPMNLIGILICLLIWFSEINN